MEFPAPLSLKDTPLFEPLKVGSVTLGHRVVLAPLTRFRAKQNVPQEVMVQYYRDRSSKPGTLVITEAIAVSPQDANLNQPGIWAENQIDGWSQIFHTIHENQSNVFVQLFSLGRQASPAYLKRNGYDYVSASAGLYKDEASEREAFEHGLVQRELTIDEIHLYTNKFVIASQNAIRAGADGVELHAANGYLLNQFLDPISNVRTDQYGGSIENRARFLLETIDAVISAIGADKVAVRLSPFNVFGGMSGVEETLIVAQNAYVIGELEKRAQQSGYRIAYISIVEPRVIDSNLEGDSDISQGSFISTDFIYSIWRGVVIKAGNFAHHPELIRVETDKPQTCIAYGRVFISNPDLPDRLYNGWPLAKYNRDTFYTSEDEGYNDYPFYSE